MDNAVALAALGLTGTVVAGFFALIKQQSKTTEKLSDSIDRMANSTADVAKYTKQGNKEAKDRNGHLAEMVADAKSSTLTALQNVNRQHVEHQHIDTQITKE